MKKFDILKYLERTDKWYLGGGNRIVWTPPFPVWLDHPGFWDKAHYYNCEIGPIFTWTVLNEKGMEISLRKGERKWNPAKLSQEFFAEGFTLREDKCCLPDDVLTSVVRIKNNSGKNRKLHFITWTIQQNCVSKGTSLVSGVEIEKNKISFIKQICRKETPLLPVKCVIGINKKLGSYSVNLSEGEIIQPHWRFTPFFENFKNGKLPNDLKLNGFNKDGLIFMAIHTVIKIGARSSKEIVLSFSAAPARKEASSNFYRPIKYRNPVRISENNWRDHFASVPYFKCSDEYLTRYYWYRWYGLKLLTIRGGEGNYKYPAVCEGIGYFRAPISFSSMCHMLDNRWMDNPAISRGSLLTFIHNQRKDGGFRGYIDPYFYRQKMFYHANWGNSLLELNRIHPDKKFLSRAYDGLVRYVRYFDRERDAEGSGLYDVNNHYETGQEYMHRYLAVDTDADKDNWGKVFRMKGVDVTVYIYLLKKALCSVARKLNRSETEISEWYQGAERIKEAVIGKMWDPELEMFFDVNPASGKRTKVKAVTCFYPYMTDIPSEKHIPGFKKHLFNPDEFWTPRPVPSSSVDDEYFSPRAEWKGKRMNCPWNGRVWPMTNSHIAEALALSAIRFNDDKLRGKTVELINKFIRMMFYDNDVTRPNCFEHYDPLTGQPSLYRGVDDYQHSWVIDLIIKYVAGLRPSDDCVIVDPFPFRLDWFTIDNVKICGDKFRIDMRNGRIIVWRNGNVIADKQIGTAINIPMDRS